MDVTRYGLNTAADYAASAADLGIETLAEFTSFAGASFCSTFADYAASTADVGIETLAEFTSFASASFCSTFADYAASTPVSLARG